MTVASDAEVQRARKVLSKVAVGEVQSARARELNAPISGGARTLTAALREFDSEEVTIDDVGLRRPTLDDVLLTLTGHAAEAPSNDTGSPNGHSTGSDKVEVRRWQHLCTRCPTGW